MWFIKYDLEFHNIKSRTFANPREKLMGFFFVFMEDQTQTFIEFLPWSPKSKCFTLLIQGIGSKTEN